MHVSAGLAVQTIWFMSELDHENGGTRILPSSALWKRTPRRPRMHTLNELPEDLAAAQKELDEAKFAEESIPATGEPGGKCRRSLCVFSFGSLTEAAARHAGLYRAVVAHGGGEHHGGPDACGAGRPVDPDVLPGKLRDYCWHLGCILLKNASDIVVDRATRSSTTSVSPAHPSSAPVRTCTGL